MMVSASIDKSNDENNWRLSNDRIQHDFDKYIVVIIGVNDDDDLFKNLSKILSKDLIQSFEDIQTGFEFIHSLNSTDMFLIVSSKLTNNLMPEKIVEQRILAVYIYCIPEELNAKSAIHNKKIRNVVSDSTALLGQLGHDIKGFIGRWSFDQKSFQKASTKESQWYHLFLLIIRKLPKQPKESYDAMFDECRAYYRDNTAMIDTINDFQLTYNNHNPVYEYTRDGFLYRIINHALRTSNMKTTKKFCPFIRDLYSELHSCHEKYIRSKGPLFRSVYRGQYLSLDELSYLRSTWKSNNPTITLTTFGSTSLDPQVAMDFSYSTSDNQVSCLFEIIFNDDYNLELNDIFYHTETLFANIESFSHMQHEQEVLFCPGTYFSIKSIEDSIDACNFPWVFIRLELVRAADRDSAVNYSNIISRLKKESDPQVYNDILDMLQICDDNRMKFRGTNWKNWWNCLKNQWGKNYLSDLHAPLHLIFYSCFTEDPIWSRKAIEIYKTQLESIPAVQSDRSSFSNLFRSYAGWAEVPALWIALYEDYLKGFCDNNTSEVVKCLCFAGNMYQKIGDYQSALECYQKADRINANSQPNINQQIQKGIKDAKKNLEKKANTQKQQPLNLKKQQDNEWQVYQLIKSSGADRSSIQNVLFRVLLYINARENFYDSYDSKIILRFPHGETEDLSVNDYYLNFLLALKDLLSSATTQDAANNHRLCLRRYKSYHEELSHFRALHDFLRPFEINVEFIRARLLPRLKRFIKKLDTLVVACFFYLCVRQSDDRIDMKNLSLVRMIDAKAKQSTYLDLHSCKMRAYLQAWEKENSTNEMISNSIPNDKRFIGYTADDFISHMQ